MRSDRLQLLTLLGLQHVAIHDAERLFDCSNAALGLHVFVQSHRHQLVCETGLKQLPCMHLPDRSNDRLLSKEWVIPLNGGLLSMKP